LQTVRHRFNIYASSCVALALWHGIRHRKLVTCLGVTRREKWKGLFLVFYYLTYFYSSRNSFSEVDLARVQIRFNSNTAENPIQAPLLIQLSHFSCFYLILHLILFR